MTGTTSDAFPTTGGGGSNEPGHDIDHSGAASAALLEQAKGVLIFRYAIDAEAAFALMQLWAAETGVGTDAVAHAVVHEICQGAQDGSGNPQLVRWLEERLRQEFPGVECEAGGEPAPVAVAVGPTEASLDAVAEAAREADRRGVPLELRADLTPQTSEPSGASERSPELERAHLMQRIDLALELARSVSPGLEVRLSRDNPLESGD